MKAPSRREREALHERRRRKTSKDFLRWLRKKNALEKQATAVSLELMVWADDGGQTN